MKKQTNARRKTKKKKTNKTNKVQKQKRECRRVPWTPAEKDAMIRSMAVFWIRKKVPNKKECDECLAKELALKRRSWRDIKHYVYNIIKKTIHK